MRISELQSNVEDWMKLVFGIRARNREQRIARFMEEALELAQACEMTQSQIEQLTRYVYDRPKGRVGQEISGVLVTLSALATSEGVVMQHEIYKELKRIQTPEIINRVQHKFNSRPSDTIPGRH